MCTEDKRAARWDSIVNEIEKMTEIEFDEFLDLTQIRAEHNFLHVAIWLYERRRGG